MESREAASYAESEASAGSFTSPSPSFQSSESKENSKLSGKDIELGDDNDDKSRSDSKGAVSEDEGYVSGNEEFEPESYKSALEENPGVLSFKPQSSPILEAIVSGGDGAEKEDGESEGVEEVSGGSDSVEKAGRNPDGGVVGDAVSLSGIEENMVILGAEMSGEEENVSMRVGDEVSGPVQEVSVEELKLAAAANVKYMPGGDSVVDHIEVDVTAPGVPVAGGTEEKENVVIEPVEEVAEPDKIVLFTRGDAEHSREGDSFDHIQVDAVGPGGSGDNGGEKLEREETPLDSFGDVTQMSTKEVVDENIIEVGKGKPLQPEHGVVGGEKNENLGAGVQTSIETNDSVQTGAIIDAEDDLKKPEVDSGAIENGFMDEDKESMIFGSSEAAKKFIEELEEESHALAGEIDGQIVTDSEEEDDETNDDDEGDGKEFLDPSALAALLKAVNGGDPSGGSITITSEDGSRLFSVERPAGLGSNLSHPSFFSNRTPSGGGREYEENLDEEERKKLEKLQQIRVKFLRLVHRLGLSPEEPVAGQVLYRLALLGGRQNTPSFSLDGAKRMALQLETEQRDDLDFSVNLLVLGKDGVGKSATVNSIFGEEKVPIDAFETGTSSVKEISGLVDGVKIHIVDTPGLKRSVLEQGLNRSILSSVKKLTKKNPADVVLYVDRLDSQSRDLNDLPLLKTIHSVLGQSIWRSAIVALTHSASAPPDGPSGAPLSYEVFVSQRSHVIQQSISQAVGDLRMVVPSMANPISLVENHPSCRKNREGHKILPNGKVWRPQLLLLCYSMKILSEASSVSKPQDLFDQRKLFGFRARTPSLPYLLSSMLQPRQHPKLPDLAGENGDSDIDPDDFSDSDHEGEESEYDQLPPFKPLKKAQIAKLSREQKRAYFEEYDYRVKLLQKKQWKEELRRIRDFKKRGNNINPPTEYDDEADNGPPAQVSVPLPDMALPPSFDGDTPAYRYRFLEPTSQLTARPVLDTHGWDHDCGYDGVNIEHSLAVLNHFPAAYTVQITKDKKDFTLSLDSSIAARPGENISAMAGFDIQNMGKQLAYIFRGETQIKNLRRNRATGGVSFTVIGENVVPALKVEDQITFGRRHTLVGSAGVVRSKREMAYGANFELQSKDDDYPVGQVWSTVSLSVIRWRGDLALGLNGLVQVGLGRNSKVAIKAGINNKMSGQVSVRTSSSDHLWLAMAAVIPTAVSVYRKLFPAVADKYPIY